MPFTICIRIPTASDSGDTGNPKLVDLRTSVSKNSDGPANGQKERRTGGNKGKAKEVHNVDDDELEYVSWDEDEGQHSSSPPEVSLDTLDDHRTEETRKLVPGDTLQGPDAIEQIIRMIDPLDAAKLINSSKEKGDEHQDKTPSGLPTTNHPPKSDTDTPHNTRQPSGSSADIKETIPHTSGDTLSFDEAGRSATALKEFEHVLDSYATFAKTALTEEDKTLKDQLLSLIGTARQVAQTRIKTGKSLLRVHEGPDCWCHAFPKTGYRQSTLIFMPLEIMDMKDQPAFAPRLGHDFESVFYVFLWSSLGARGGGKAHRRCSRPEILPRELRSNRSFDTIKKWKTEFYFNPRNGRSVVNDIQFTDPNAMNFALGLYDLFRCSTLGGVHNTFTREDLLKKGEAVPEWLTEHGREDVPPGAMAYFTGARQNGPNCEADCCRMHWATWAKRMNMRVFPYDVSERRKLEDNSIRI